MVNNRFKELFSKIIHKKREKYSLIKKDIDKQLVLLEGVEEVSSKIREIFKNYMNLDDLKIIIYNDSKQTYKILDDNEDIDINFNKYLAFFMHIEMNNEVINLKNFKTIKNNVNEAYNNYINDFDFDLVVPLIFEKRIIGIINIKENKKFKLDNKDIYFLSNISTELSSIFTNAMLFTRMKQIYEETEKQNEELKTLDKSKSAFLANVSHELRTPLISIKGYVELMKLKKLGEINEKQQKGLEISLRNIERLERLINSLLLYAQIEAKKIKINLTENSIKEIIKECIEEQIIIAKNKKIELIYDEKEEDIFLYCDKDKIKQVLINLIDNSIKFTEEGKVNIIYKKENNNILIIIKDTGIGIPKEKISSLFKRFQQLDDSIDRKYGGTGLGLAIVKSIIELHNGSIKTESELGKGTIMTIRLPLKNNN
jgi:signal transduction histidine kinase